jgi:hypothetical protein
LLLSLERVGVVDPPEYTYREYNFRGTLRCDLMIFVGKSTLYPDMDPWFTPPPALGSQTPTERLPEKPYDAYAWSISIIFSELLWDFSHLLEEEDAHGLPG